VIAWDPRLLNGTRSGPWRMIEAEGIDRPDADEDIGADGLLAGRASTDSQ